MDDRHLRGAAPTCTACNGLSPLAALALVGILAGFGSGNFWIGIVGVLALGAEAARVLVLKPRRRATGTCSVDQTGLPSASASAKVWSRSTDAAGGVPSS